MEESANGTKRLRRTQARLLEPLPPTPPQGSKAGDDTAPTQRAPPSDSDDDDVDDLTVPYNDEDVHRRITPWPVALVYDSNRGKHREQLVVPPAVKLNSRTHIEQLIHFMLHRTDHRLLNGGRLLGSTQEVRESELLDEMTTTQPASLLAAQDKAAALCVRATTAMSTCPATGSPATPPPQRNLSSGSASPAATAFALASDAAASACPPQTTSTTETATPATTTRATCDSCPAASTAADDDAQP
jgi:hypothetical protein